MDWHPIGSLALTLLLLAVAPPASPAAGDLPDLASSWAEVDRSIAEARPREALELVEEILVRARSAGDDLEWARALARAAQLRGELDGYETAVRELHEAPWPDTPVPRLAVQLFYARSLATYAQVYQWEVSTRERRVGPDEIDLRAWTREQIAAEADRVYRRIWAHRDEWGGHNLGDLAELFVEPNDFPPRIRGTLRDAVTYLWADHLAISSLWSPWETEGVQALDRELLLAGGPDDFLPVAKPPEAGEDPSGAQGDESHPLIRLAALLADLEAWHLERGEAEAAFEARHARLERLWHALGRRDRDAVREALARRLEELGREWEWWSRGMATLASWTSLDDTPDAQVRARELALECARPRPASVGARRCRHLVAVIEAPYFSLQAMTADGAGERSILIEHRNLAELWFRAYALDLASTVERSRDYNLLPRQADVPGILAGSRSAAEWRTTLPETPDYRSHRTYVTPPLSTPGLYLVVASARSDFAADENQRAAVSLIVTDLVLLVRQEADRLHVTAVSGETGEPRPGARVDLYVTDFKEGHRRVSSTRAGKDGSVDLALEARSGGYFVLGQDGDHPALDSRFMTPWGRPPSPSDRTQSMIYTDRSVYRPGQTLRWKIVLFRGVAEEGRFRALPETEVTVRLVDANGERVGEETVATNGFGSASGRFEVPAGRLLGAWTVTSSVGGGATVQVEEYRRPTFEVTLEEPGETLRLGRPALLHGESRYYFGQPVSGGEVSWRITREPVLAPWRGYLHGVPPGSSTETVALGRSRLDPDGRFEVAFTPAGLEEEPAEAGGTTYRYRLHAEVTAEGGETRSASRSFAIGAVAITARVEETAGFHRAGEPVTLAVVRTDLDGTPRPGTGRWRLVRLGAPERTLLPAEVPEPVSPGAEDAHRTAGDRLRPRWEGGYEPRGVLAGWADGAEVTAGRLEHGDDGRARVSAGRLSPGAYRLVYETEDRFGARFETRHDLLVVRPGDRLPAPRRRAPALPLAALLRTERDTVEPGGTARFLVHSGLPEQAMLLEIRRLGRPVERRWLTAGDGPRVLELPVGPELRGGLAVSLTVVRDHQMIQLSERISVPWSDRELAVELATFRDRLRPGSREEWRVTVRAADGEDLAQGAAEVLASMYDRSLDLFAPHRPPSPLGLYPRLGHQEPLRTTLGSAQAIWWQRNGWVRLPGYPPLRGDRVELGIGRHPAAPPHPYAVDGVLIWDMAAIALERFPTARDPWNAVTTTPGVLSDRINVGGNASPAYYEFDQAEEITVTSESPLLDARSMASAVSAPPPAVVPRTDFAETAFFEPHLLTGADGSVAFAFTVPDSVTEWNVWVQAVTRDLRAGSAEGRARTVKELLVRPYLPRFLREGDRAEVRIVVDNTGEETLRGALRVDLFDPETGESRLAAFGLAPEEAHDLPFQVAPGDATTLTLPLAVPPGVGAVAFRATARAGEWSDGEQRPLPVLPGRYHLVQSRFAALHDAERETLRFDDLAAAAGDPTLLHDRFVVTLDGQLFDAVLRALPYLVEYPYECTEQTLNRFLSTAVVFSVFDRYPAVAARARELSGRDTKLEPWDRDDPNREMALVETPWLLESRGGGDGDSLLPVLDPGIAAAHRDAALLRLRQSQTSLGGFPWFPGGPPSPYLTLYLLQGFSRALDAGVAVPPEMVAGAWAYVHRHYEEQIRRSADGVSCCGPLATFLAYVLSSYPEGAGVDWTAGVWSAGERHAVLDSAFAHWTERSRLQKAQLAVTLHRAGRRADARRVFDSLMDGARTDEELGTSWAPEERAWLWYHDSVEMHAYALRAMNEIAPDDPRRHGLVQWLLLDRKLGHWKSTRATAEVVHALVDYLEREGELGVREEARVRAGAIDRTFVFEPDAPLEGPARIVVPGSEVTPALAEVTVEKETPGFLFASATWHFSTERPPAAGDGDLLAVERSYFRRVPGLDGWTLEPLAADDAVAVGDQVEVHLSVRARHATEYVHLRDPRGAGFEPEALTSGYRWDLGVGRYEEVRDSGTDLFFERLPAGEYTFIHRLRGTTVGAFRVAPATLQSLYAPEFAAHSAGHELRVAGGAG